MAGYAEAIPNAQAVLCRLRVTPQTQAERISRRGVLQAGDSATNDDVLTGLRACVKRSARFAAKLEAEDLADFTVDTDGVPIKTVVDRVQAGIAASGWEPLVT